MDRRKTTPGTGFRRQTVLLCAGLLVLTACVWAGPEEMTAEAWQEDLSYLAKALPAKHGNAFHQVSREELEGAVARLQGRIPELEDHQVAVELGRIVAMIGDGHTELWLTQQPTGFRRLPLALAYFGDDLYVFAATEGFEEAIGQRVLAIGGVPIREAYDRVVPLIARDNDYELLRSAPIYLTVTEILHALGITASPDEAVFRLEGPKGTSELLVRAASGSSDATWTTARELASSPAPLYLKNRDTHHWFEYLEASGTVYVKYDKCKDQSGHPSIRRFAKELFAFVDSHAVERLVVDIRHNTGGNFHRNRPLIDGIKERPRINQPGRLFVITSRTTFSAATLAAIDLKQETAALIVGEPSRGRPNGYSDEKHLRLPNSRIEVNYSPLYRAAMPELGDAPFLPVDVAVENSFDDYRSGRDRVLEAVLSWKAADGGAPWTAESASSDSISRPDRSTNG